MFARFFAWGLTACLIGCALGGCKKSEPPAPDAPESAARPPVNVLLITLDTTRADHIGCYGSTTARTPALDGLAAGGLRFDQAFCHVPLTSPSHVSLMTGTYPAVNGVRTNGMSVSESEISTLAEKFKTTGYQTGAFIAAFVLHARFGLNRGFDRYDDDLRDAQAVSGEMLERRGDLVCDSALAWLDQHASDPFFAWVHFFDPHSPYAPPEPYGSEFTDPYDGEIAFTDAQVQRLVNWLDEKNLRERTLIVVAGDHGEAFGEHGETQHGYFIYEPTLHVPLIFSLPSRVPSGKVVTTPVGLVDVFPTLMELMQWEGPPTLDGRSLVDVWKSSRAAGRPVYAESESPRLNYAWARLRSLTTVDWKYIDAPRAELYDRRTDPGETNNVIADHAEEAARLKKALQELVATMTPRFSGTAQLDSAARRRLESLGYAGAGAPVVAENDEQPGRDPKDMLLIYQAHLKAIELLRAGKVTEVIRILEPVIGQCPESSLMQQTLGRAYLEVGRLADAQKAYEVSLQQSPYDAQKLLGMAEALRQQNKNREAKEWFLRALAVEPDLAEAHRGLGLVYSATGDLPNAEKCFRRHVELSSESTNALSNLANALMLQQKYAAAAPVFEKMIRIDPKDENAHHAYWQALMGAGMRADAIRALRAACEAIPNDANLYCSLAWYLSIGLEGEGVSPEATVQLGLRCRDANPRSPRTWDILAAAYASTGQFPEAVQAAKKALSIAQELGKQPIAAQIAARLRLYESNRPFRQ